MAIISVQLKDGKFELFGGEFYNMLEEVKDYPSHQRRYDATSKTWAVDDTSASFQKQMVNSAHQLRPVAAPEAKKADGFTLPKDLLNQASQLAGGRIQSAYPSVTRQWIRAAMTSAAMKFGDIPEVAVVRPGKMPKRFFVAGEGKIAQIEKIATWIEEDVIEAEIAEGNATEALEIEDTEISEPDMEDAYHFADSLPLVGSPKQIAWAKSIALSSLEAIAGSRVSTLPTGAKWWIDNRGEISEALKSLKGQYK